MMRYICSSQGLSEALRQRLGAFGASTADTGYYARALDLTDDDGAITALPPHSASLEITQRCQLQCDQCPRPPGDAEMPLVRVHEALAGLQSAGVTHLLLQHLGEPLVHPEFPAILAAACRQFHVRLITNGLLLSPSLNGIILAAQPHRLAVSLDDSHRAASAAAGETHALAMLTRLRRERDLRGLDGPVAVVQAVVTEALAADTERLTRWQAAADAVDLCSRVWPVENAGVPADEPCPVAFRHLVVRVDGRMHVCCADAAGELTVGNLFTDGVEAAWQGERAWHVRRRLLARDWPAPCRECVLRSPAARRAFAGLVERLPGAAAEDAGL